MNLTITEIMNVVGGELRKGMKKEYAILGVSTDSRNINKEDLFVPLVGEKFDGHQFIDKVLEKGVSISFWNKSHPLPKNPIDLILVDDTLKALQDLANYYRKKINPIVVGVTGSNGKTTTKDILTSILSMKYNVHKTLGNLNNHIGVPLTILAMPEKTEVAVIEMGMSNIGEISVLSNVAKPNIALITNIGESHLEFLKTRENIANAKLEILDGLIDNGWIVLNGDEPLLREAMKHKERSFKTIWVGKNNENDYYPKIFNMVDANKMLFVDSDNESYTLPLIGVHNVINALMGISVGRLLKLSKDELKRGLLDLKLTGMRLEQIKSKNGSLILNDAYNASPTSMKASLKLLESLRHFSKKIAVLGDMLELGEAEAGYHKEIGKICSELQIDELITTGSLGKWIIEGARENGMEDRKLHYFEHHDKIADYILNVSDSNTAILIKGSRGVHLEKVTEILS